ncbi:putative quinol monooxygenase [Haladaptatus sp. CMSO5]|uniref:putative quinol monooxygenase n=1 Tax=Haladaptatus sp. CMSO5 TaxID=3120514 RepID=UPI002FCE1EDB
MQIVYATLPIEPSHRDEALEATRVIAEKSRQEPGVIDYRANVDVEDANLLRFIEQYEDAAAVEAHLETEHYLQYEDTVIPDMLSGEPEIVQFETTG